MRIWRVGIARNAAFFNRFMASPAEKVSPLGGHGAQNVAKICTTPAREHDFEVKIVKN